MTERCREAGFDLTTGPVKVSPTAHYHMGGVRMDGWGTTNLEGLFVAGEDAGGVHGANRLGGNGVAESTVFGARAGDRLADYVQGKSQPAVSPAQVKAIMEEVLRPLQKASGERIYAVRSEIEDLMWEQVGLVRHATGLRQALVKLAELTERLQRVAVPDFRGYNLAWGAWLDVRSILTVAKLTSLSALARTESRGSHYRSDYPEPDNVHWLCNIMVQREAGGEPRLWTERVKFSRLPPPATGVPAARAE